MWNPGSLPSFAEVLSQDLPDPPFPHHLNSELCPEYVEFP